MQMHKDTPEALSCLPRQALRQMLAAELEKDYSQIDDDLVRLLMAEMQRRGTDPAFTDDEAVEAACEKFRQDTAAASTPRKRRFPRWALKAASVLVALSILFFALPAAAQAGDVRGALGWWEESVFQFFAPDKNPTHPNDEYHTDHPGLQEIYDTVTELGITQQIVPSQLSRDFELTELKVAPMFDDISIHTRLVNSDTEQRILLSYVIHGNQTTLQHEKTEDTVTVWELAENEHYVIANTNELTVTWVAGNVECTVTTNCPEKDVYALIKSVYTSEG